jgi:hypothetical protein
MIYAKYAMRMKEMLALFHVGITLLVLNVLQDVNAVQCADCHLRTSSKYISIEQHTNIVIT